jgi:NAD(P)-dependent dehydrogenase (short-subunit alcohol dehydrogenase family)
MDDKNKLYAIVNNAGTGIAHGTSLAEILDTNVRGPRRVVDNFLPLLDPKVGRIVNVGSGAAPGFVSSMLTTKREKTQYVSPMDREEIEEEILKVERMNDDYAAYAGSKALLACYTMSLAREHPNLSIAILTPGYIKTNMTKGYGATKSPCEGTVALRKCLFDDLTGKSGYFWGSDGLRSPLHYLRNPGEPEYDSEAPTF